MAPAKSQFPLEGRPEGVPGGSVATVSPSALATAVTNDAAATGSLLPGSLDSMSDVWWRFARFCEQGLKITDADVVTSGHLQQFLHAPRAGGGELSNASRHQRRGCIRYLYGAGRGLGLVNIDPTRDVVLPPRSVLSTRPLTDDEIELCRLWALASFTDMRLPVVWALAECTAAAAEIPFVRIRDVDLDGRTVRLPGNRRRDSRLALVPRCGEPPVKLG